MLRKMSISIQKYHLILLFCIIGSFYLFSIYVDIIVSKNIFLRMYCSSLLN
ncbi:hypothetical protein Scep_024044 [Stephania cephalantha]|uniref:Uncharacterized protein n=1 Tax=Stephania cephalantha TaxID=152367 RepID=A0AAP0F4R5_9MAGN